MQQKWNVRGSQSRHVECLQQLTMQAGTKSGGWLGVFGVPAKDGTELPDIQDDILRLR